MCGFKRCFFCKKTQFSANESEFHSAGSDRYHSDRITLKTKGKLFGYFLALSFRILQIILIMSPLKNEQNVNWYEKTTWPPKLLKQNEEGMKQNDFVSRRILRWSYSFRFISTKQIVKLSDFHLVPRELINEVTSRDDPCTTSLTRSMRGIPFVDCKKRNIMWIKFCYATM